MGRGQEVAPACTSMWGEPLPEGMTVCTATAYEQIDIANLQEGPELLERAADYHSCRTCRTCELEADSVQRPKVPTKRAWA